MSFMSWLSSSSSLKAENAIKDVSNTQQDKARHINSSPVETTTLSFDDIATRFGELNETVTKLQKQCADYEVQIKGHLTQLQDVRNQKQQQDSLVKTLRKNVADEKTIVSDLQSAIAGNEPLKPLRKKGQVKPFTSKIAAERQELLLLRKKVKEYDTTAIDWREELNHVKLENTELKFSLEELRCTNSSQAAPKAVDVPRPQAGMPLPEIPFVLVLVDGDAYHFAEVLPNKYADPSVHPAARMAGNIKASLRAYIDINGLPQHCKFHVRVLVNGKGFRKHGTTGGSKGNARSDALADFMLRFTESDRLFEFFDVGVGKERVDGKIQELYQMFLPNPSCHKIFLATARDNGFARMIEPFIHHPTTRAKTCIISAGDVAAEIERLNLETVEWPTVFAHQTRPREVIKRLARREERQRAEDQIARKIQEGFMQALGKEGYEKMMERKRHQYLTQELVGLKNANEMVQDLIGLDKRNMGVRTETLVKKQVDVGKCAGEDQEADINDDDGDDQEHFCIEVGVD